MDMDIQTKIAIKDYFTLMKNDGVISFKNLITLDEIAQLKNEIKHIREIVMAKIKTMDRPLKNYSDIAERHLGRLDYRCGFIADIFTKVAESISRLINQLSPTINFRYYWGAIPSHGESGP